MQYQVNSVEEYLEAIPDERKIPVMKLRDAILKKLPKGFQESIGYGMVGYCVPHSLYPSGYHCNPEQPLPYGGFASQKNSINVYHMGIYSDPKIMDWFLKAYTQLQIGKPDMGKSCIRFKKAEKIPFELIGELFAKMTPKQWITTYEKVLKK